MSRLIFAFFTCGIIAVTHSASLVESPSTKIIGGRPALDGMIPYQVSLQLDNEHVCGGSIVEVFGQQVVLTSAICVIEPTLSTWTIVAGELDRTSTSGHEQRRFVTDYITHENYTTDRYGYINDIAIMFYDAPFDLNEFVQPVALPKPMQQTTGDVIVSGWGSVGPGSYLSDVLNFVVVPTLTDYRCAFIYNPETVLESHLCSGVLEGAMSSCSGDGGGPVVAIEGDYLAGIISWNFRCVAYPGINTEVSYFVEWIESTVAAH